MSRHPGRIRGTRAVTRSAVIASVSAFAGLMIAAALIGSSDGTPEPDATGYRPPLPCNYTSGVIGCPTWTPPYTAPRSAAPAPRATSQRRTVAPVAPSRRNR